jgi:hypothetical protein
MRIPHFQDEQYHKETIIEFGGAGSLGRSCLSILIINTILTVGLRIPPPSSQFWAKLRNTASGRVQKLEATE